MAVIVLGIAVAYVSFLIRFESNTSPEIARVTADADAWRIVLASSSAAGPADSPGIGSSEVRGSSSTNEVLPDGTPVRIKILAIHVNAAVQRVALAEDGSMGVPALPTDVAWYSLGPKPGQIGSAVLAGHVDWYGGVTGVFADLDTLAPGDTVVILDDYGSEISFVVREVRAYGSGDDATDVFVSTDGVAHLNLVTCTGIWDRDAGQYTKRLVVFSDRVTE
ncbi:hypothetical protein A2348_04795 [Candidatus Uhrbacteria bacterium RIFOXYB12_FULL_58_10]|uniref:Class F sortase n=1 Tax=Candidatus Uhrbacteria bacterium RIFOXYB2_FULL_57_15 TaxID=1802422 RepID=A0A1F7W8S2_9BACT|nr:MAG: hypothetical protein A2348_04795 [Candidatus Uhrbacteria bacterium RIFOXYB12_FULL_58_10]OGL98788.1 MAG: hypothetical protein A2304_04820 [Candidatus Uhrbacteria bacterium RIFOXYB2_FULL_57_15]OGL99800.1 MAG: hypothetical protein A2501_04730 [Candidatus Uhrbacteria bacterium RIFOXYC12_FULL_57_11]